MLTKKSKHLVLMRERSSLEHTRIAHKWESDERTTNEKKNKQQTHAHKHHLCTNTPSNGHRAHSNGIRFQWNWTAGLIAVKKTFQFDMCCGRKSSSWIDNWKCVAPPFSRREKQPNEKKIMENEEHSMLPNQTTNLNQTQFMLLWFGFSNRNFYLLIQIIITF